MLTRSKVIRFVKIRNKAEFVSNLQFQSDAQRCGIALKDIGQARKFTIDGFVGYEWTFPVKGEAEPAVLVEYGRSTFLKGEPETAELFELMKRAAYAVPAPKTPPTPDDRRSGCKVGWYYYKSEHDAQAASAWAFEEGKRRAAQGYDFGYQSPGSLTLCRDGQHAGLFEVCVG